MNRTKTLTNESMIRNITGLSLGDRAYCGPYGTVTCTKAAGGVRGARRFKVSGSRLIRNGGNWSMKTLRAAIAK